MINIPNNTPKIFQNINSFNKDEKTYNRNFSDISEKKELSTGERTLLPVTAQILLGNDFLLNTRNPELAKLLNSKRQVIIGGNPSCNINPNPFYNGIGQTHLSLEKTQNGIVAKDLTDGQGKTQIIPETEIKPFTLGSDNIKLSQGNIGDCFLLAPMYALSQNPKGREYLEKMVSIDKDGNYIVKFHNAIPIIVNQSELNGETYKNGTIKECVSGDLTIRAIERAYAKLIKNPDDNADFLKLNNGGYTQESLYRMTGLHTYAHPTKDNCNETLKEIETNGIENYILTCSTPPQGNYGKYMDANGKFISAHAYAIKSIDTKSGIIEIVNPHNTKISEKISISDFEKMFNFMYIAHI